MSNKLKKFISNPWLIAIVSPIITAGIFAFIKDINFIEASDIIWHFIKHILNYNISLKVIILVIVILFGGLKVYFKILDYKEEFTPDWLRYTMDKYKEWYFKWDYIKYGNKYTIENIRPICRCGCGLNRKSQHKNIYYGGGALVCPKCNNSYNIVSDDDMNDFRIILNHNIETKRYNLNTSINNSV